MTHWDDERDARWVQMLRECKVPSSEWVVLGFEAPGGFICWSVFIKHMSEVCNLRKKNSGTFSISLTR